MDRGTPDRRRLHAWWRARATVLVVLGVGACASPPEADPPIKNKPMTGESEVGSTSDGGAVEAVGDRCADAPVLTQSTWRGSLWNADAEAGGACGRGGPEVFVRVSTPVRADLEVEARGNGFTPRIDIRDRGCDDDGVLACATGLPAQVLELAAGAEAWIAIGIDPADPRLEEANDLEGLSFELTTRWRDVVARGDGCGLPGQGRCETGTACIAAADGSQRCQTVLGDTCASAIPVVLSQDGASTVTIDPASPHDDAHAHSCAGARRPEAVLLVSWDAPADGGDLLLTASSEAADVALAIRSPGCLAADERACVDASPAAAPRTLQVDAAGLASAFVFIELPTTADARSELGPFAVSLALSRP